MWILSILIYNLFIVFLIELTLGFLLGARDKRKIISMALVNVITNPAVVLCMLSVTMFFNELQYIVLIVLEVGVVFLEGFLFSKFRIFENKKAYLNSFVLNLASFLVGKIISFF